MNPLGRIQLHDPRSLAYAPKRQYVHEIGQISVRHAMNAPNADQFYTSGCVGFSGTNMLNCSAALRSRTKFNQLFWTPHRAAHGYLTNEDGLHNYSEATANDPFPWLYPPTDEGSSALGLMKFWKRYGIIAGYEWAFTFDQFLGMLQSQPVLVGTQWYESMMTPDASGLVRPQGDIVGGHEYLATAINWTRQFISFENSWGESWGQRGRFYMTFDSVERLLIDEGGDAVAPKFL